MTDRLRQEIILCDVRVAGSFRYRDLFQLEPIYPDAPTIEWAIGHYPCLLEYKYSVPDISETKLNPALPKLVIDPILDNDHSRKIRKDLLLILSTLSKWRLFQYSTNPLNQQWFVSIPRNTDDHQADRTPFWGTGGYHYKGASVRMIDDFSPADSTLIKLRDSREYYGTETPRQYVIGETPNEFELPDRIRQFLDSYLSCSDERKAAFRASSLLFDQGIQLFYEAPSLAFAACVSSLETLVAFDYRNEQDLSCQECGQKVFHVRQKFLKFIKQYGDPSLEARKVADRVYERRSKILHTGQLFLSETTASGIEDEIDWLPDDQARRDVIRFFRVCMVNWLTANPSTTGAL